MKISRAQSYKSTTNWKASDITWEELVEFLTTPVVGKRKDINPYVLGELAGGRRKTANVVSRDALTIDADNGEGFPDKLEAAGFECLWHSTYSHSPIDKQFKYRAVVRLSRPVTADEYGEVVLQFLARAGIDHGMVDMASCAPAQLMFGPATPIASRFSSGVVHGEVFDADSALKDPVDASEVLGSHRRPYQSKRKKSLDAPGDVGAFNNAYPDLDELIEVFDLPYVKVGDRWRYEPSHSQPAMGPVSWDEHLWFSHHATDPAYGRACSAFDLVRIHKFGELDEEAKPNTPVAKLPSHLQMKALVQFDERVKARISEAALEILGLDDDAEGEWHSGLMISPRGALVDNVHNFHLIVCNDPWFSDLYWSDMFKRVKFRGRDFVDMDITDARRHFNKTYNLNPAKNDLADVMEGVAKTRPRHEVRDYLESLRWDGIPRVETALPVKEHTDYTRKVARVVLVSAVQRVFEPGSKVDNMLMLYGTQGLGKTTWIERMAVNSDWRLILPRINPRGDNVEAKRSISQSWIVIADEAQPHSGEDDESLKAFLTATKDEYRRMRKDNVESYPRQCVIWGTTNDPTPLREGEGNRRFLIVTCGKVDFDALTPEYVEQVWAEAVYMYRRGEETFIRQDQLDWLMDELSSYTKDSGVRGVVKKFGNDRVPRHYETPDPESGVTMSHDERCKWFQGGGREFYSPDDLVMVTEVSVGAILNVMPSRRHTQKLKDEIIRVFNSMPDWKYGGRRMTPFGEEDVWEHDFGI